MANSAFTQGRAGVVLDYTELQTFLPVTDTGASPDVVITGSSISYDGSTEIKITFFSPAADINLEVAESSGRLDVWLYENGSVLCILSSNQINGIALDADTVFPLMSSRIMTPAAGSRAYSVRASVGATNDDGGSGISGGTGTSGDFAAAFLLIETTGR